MAKIPKREHWLALSRLHFILLLEVQSNLAKTDSVITKQESG